MNLFKEVTTISNSKLQSNYEFDSIAEEIKRNALADNRFHLVMGDINESVKNELVKQGFTIEREYIAGRVVGYTIKW